VKLLILDKDGSIVTPKTGAEFVRHPKDQELLPGVKETIARYHSEGWRIVVASNQGAVEAGHKTVEEAIAEFRCLMELLPEISACYFCPDFEGRFCYEVVYGNWIKYDRNDMEGFYGFRKPYPGMIQLATDPGFGEALSLDEILFVGDRAEDEACAKAAGIASQWAHEFFGGASNG
jgi:D-glycero-D-manno-heptose 1,7-bisphosphate phosphatase